MFEKWINRKFCVFVYVCEAFEARILENVEKQWEKLKREIGNCNYT
jgi:hypothetical protein